MDNFQEKIATTKPKIVWGLFAILSLALLAILILYISPYISGHIGKYDMPITRGSNGVLNVNISERPWFLNLWYLFHNRLIYFGWIPLIISFVALFQKGFTNKILGFLTLVGLLFLYLYLNPPLPLF